MFEIFPGDVLQDLVPAEEGGAELDAADGAAGGGVAALLAHEVPLGALVDGGAARRGAHPPAHHAQQLRLQRGQLLR